MSHKKKLIEVALPLEAINTHSAREKSIRHGHPSTLHLWWARRPLAAARAVIWASLVDDPSSLPEQFPTEEEQTKERERLFAILSELVKWENSNNQEVLNAAKAEIMKSTNNNPPALLDPFAGGGSIPLEAQRLGLEAHASDLNPVAVMINKAMIEIPPKFAGLPPVNPDSNRLAGTWTGAQGLAEDVRYYGEWMKQKAFEKIGHLYPKVKDEHGHEHTVIAWIWARTVKCPNPAFEASGYRKFGLLWKLLRNGLLEKDSVLFWDEPENSLNKELVPELVDILLMLAKNGVQIFIATHDYHFARYFDVRKDKSIPVMFHNLSKSQNGGIDCVSSSEYTKLPDNSMERASEKLYESVISDAFGVEDDE